MLSDTDPRVERVQIELLRRAGPARRFELCARLSADGLNLVRAGLAQRYPNETPEQLKVRFVECCYGPQLAEAVARRLRGS